MKMLDSNQLDNNNVVQLQHELKTRQESYWVKRGEKMALKLFHEMSNRVPAYADFLKKRGFNPKSVNTIIDFASIPLISKDNYLRKYPLEQLCWDGKFSDQRWVISTTSGSTGEPFYFPRTDLQDEYYALTAELYLRENFKIQGRSTLYIDAFAMGAWIGGLFTYEAIHRVAKKGYAISIITPGINKAEVINTVRKLGTSFDQVIIGCYPPILRDIIDLGVEEGLDWGKYNLGVVFSAEGFSEEFRDYIFKHGKLENIYTSSLNHYGTVDQGTISHETPMSILIRRLALQNKELYSDMFRGVTKQPTLTQFLPEMFYFEEVDNGVVCSSNSGIPLVRYDLKDHGGVMSLSHAEKLFTKHGMDLSEELIKNGLDNYKWNLPFAYVYERSDFSVNLVGGVVYPEEIRQALLDPRLQNHLTGKFTMTVDYDKDMQPKLGINVEMKRNKKRSATLAENVQMIIVDKLLKDNSEYASNYTSYGERLWPVIQLWSYGDPKYFSGKGKQKWVKK